VTRYLGVDFGTKRVGLAISDGLGLTARPLEVVPREAAVDRINALIAEYDVERVIVGLPTGLEGQAGVSVAGARELGAEIEADSDVTVELVDERFTSRIAESVLLESGMRRRERRATVDKVAAAIILQGYLDSLGSEGNQEAR
jgi:putative Holliday junction resolvase